MGRIDLNETIVLMRSSIDMTNWLIDDKLCEVRFLESKTRNLLDSSKSIKLVLDLNLVMEAV